MYHITGGPELWRRDFAALARAGFARVVLADPRADLARVRAVLDVAAQFPLRAYWVAFNPMFLAEQMRERRDPMRRFLCVGIDGQTLDFYNPYSPACRRAVLQPYLAETAKALGDHPALAGYFLDDCMDASSIISYTGEDQSRFRSYIRQRYDRLDVLSRRWGIKLRTWHDVSPPRITLTWRPAWRRWWQDWCEARQSWWLQWADDVLAAVRGRGRLECILGDDWYSLRFGQDVTGGFTPAMVRKFDSFSFDYTAGALFLDRKMSNLDRDVLMARDLAERAPVTVFLRAAAAEKEPFPTARSLIEQSRRCFKAGAAGIDLYIYRAWEGNYAYRQCLANHLRVFREFSAFVRSLGAAPAAATA